VKLVLEALQGQKTGAQLCREYNIAPDLNTHWKQNAIELQPHWEITLAFVMAPVSKAGNSPFSFVTFSIVCLRLEEKFIRKSRFSRSTQRI
jgi:hypothetical protein